VDAVIEEESPLKTGSDSSNNKLDPILSIGNSEQIGKYFEEIDHMPTTMNSNKEQYEIRCTKIL